MQYKKRTIPLLGTLTLYKSRQDPRGIKRASLQEYTKRTLYKNI